MDRKKLNEILEKHSSWLRNETEGTRANLRGADLRGANLYGATLCEADLREADLRGANLYGATLCEADLRGANLYGATLRGANLREADLYGAKLCEADLREADLRGANLYGANLYGATLREADLYGAKLRGANLYGATLRGAKNIPYIPMTCPDTGEFIAWKKAYGEDDLPCLVKLRIPKDARRSSATGRKCRADKAEVLAIEPIEPVSVIVDKVRSKYDPDFYYQVGQCITITDFDTDRFNECAPGIHFFINRQEAIDYRFA